ncbi:hypothetical protein CKO_02916 [Citrobacter koseri ATCC BAA-895]|uniref:Uncharacterized protein n=1 Tax=Citrobacter koseri (strain ATCC BAA-895 / CDC 4225-83 / SGSC4696) TaxID=290338 RepID=A8AKK8_CITK8|nr:hypothetical protein CKO_02916 [Citrobacter koseri ATCC BAA-895]
MIVPPEASVAALTLKAAKDDAITKEEIASFFIDINSSMFAPVLGTNISCHKTVLVLLSTSVKSLKTEKWSLHHYFHQVR